MAPLLWATVLFASIFLLSLAPTTIERSCTYAGVLSQLPGTPLEGFACAEFFLNRYQALIGVGTGFVIGVIAVYPVWLQVKLLARQTVLSGQSLVADAIEQTANDIIQLDSIKIKILHRIDHLDSLIEFYDEEANSHLSAAILKAFADLRRAATEALLERDRFSEAPRLTAVERNLRQSLFKALGEIVTATHLRVPSPDETSDEKSSRDLAWIVKAQPSLNFLLPQLQNLWDKNREGIQHERATLLRHFALVRETITAMAEND